MIGTLREIVVALLIAVVLLGAVPMVCSCYQFVLVALHRWHDHYEAADPSVLPRVVVLVPAWNEQLVLRFSIDRMMRLDYPSDRLRVVVVDDASDDGTAELLEAKQADYPGRVIALRREHGGQGKAQTLNYGLREVLADAWAEAVLITDADVVLEPTALRRLTRHFADPEVGAVTAFIREASEPPNWLNRYIGYEYCAAQAAGRRAQNVLGAQACLAGGAQLHTRANLEALGGQIDTSTLAEDTMTTFRTQLDGRRVIFDGNAQCLAEEPAEITGLWKQRLRWARGNVQVTRQLSGVFFRRSGTHGLGGMWFGLWWLSTLLLPGLMVLATASLIGLWWLRSGTAQTAFQSLWWINVVGFVFTTTFTLLLDRRIARRSWFQAVAFPGLVSLVVMAWIIAPGPMRAVARRACDGIGLGWTPTVRTTLLLTAYIWTAGCMVAAWLVYRLDRSGRARSLVPVLLFIVGYGPLLSAITFAAYVAEARGVAVTWDKTVKTGKLAAR